MLVIRMQRTGRKGHAQFRVVVQDSRRTPTSGNIVAALGHYNPHTKEVVLDKEKAQTYLNNGAQPSERATRLLKAEGVKLPSWVKIDNKKAGVLRNAEKLRRNRPPEAEKPAEPEAPAEEAVAEEAPADEVVAEAPATEEAPAEEVGTATADAEAPAEETPAEETASEEPAEEEKAA